MQYLLASPSLSYSHFISRMRCSTKCHRSPYLRGREMPGGVVPLDHHFVTFVTCILIVRWSCCFFEASLYRVAASPCLWERHFHVLFVRLVFIFFLPSFISVLSDLKVELSTTHQFSPPATSSAPSLLADSPPTPTPPYIPFAILFFLLQPTYKSVQRLKSYPSINRRQRSRLRQRGGSMCWCRQIGEEKPVKAVWLPVTDSPHICLG